MTEHPPSSPTTSGEGEGKALASRFEDWFQTRWIDRCHALPEYPDT